MYGRKKHALVDLIIQHEDVIQLFIEIPLHSSAYMHCNTGPELVYRFLQISDHLMVPNHLQALCWLQTTIYNYCDPLQWRHHGRDRVSNHRRLHCFLNRLFRRRSKNTPKLRVTGPLWGEFTGEQWIPRTKGPLRGICFHLMTSSWFLWT